MAAHPTLRFSTRAQRVWATLVSLASIQVASAAHAQSSFANGSRIASPTEHMSSGDAARATMARFADCVVKFRRNQIKRFLAEPADMLDHDAVDKIGMSDCLDNGGSLTMQGPVFRGALFAALYRADYAQMPGDIGERPLETVHEVNNPTSPYAREFLTLADFGDCVARADAATSRTAVMVKVDSPAETAAFAALAPHFGACFPAGLKATLNKAVIVGVLGEALYREDAAARAQKSAMPTASGARPAPSSVQPGASPRP